MTSLETILDKLFTLEKGVDTFAEKIAPVFVALDWKWRGEIPNVQKIRSTVINLIYTMKEEMRKKLPVKPFIVATGGIVVTVSPDGDTFNASLEFVVESKYA